MRSLLILLLVIVSTSAEIEDDYDKDAELDKCDVLFECYMHPQCSRTLDAECFNKFEELLQTHPVKRMLADKRTGQGKLKTILLGSYLHRMG